MNYHSDYCIVPCFFTGNTNVLAITVKNKHFHVTNEENLDYSAQKVHS